MKIELLSQAATHILALCPCLACGWPCSKEAVSWVERSSKFCLCDLVELLHSLFLSSLVHSHVCPVFWAVRKTTLLKPSLYAHRLELSAHRWGCCSFPCCIWGTQASLQVEARAAHLQMCNSMLYALKFLRKRVKVLEKRVWSTVGWYIAETGIHICLCPGVRLSSKINIKSGEIQFSQYFEMMLRMLLPVLRSYVKKKNQCITII